MSSQKLNRRAERVWKYYFANSSNGLDYYGSLMLKSAYNNKNSRYGWVVDRIIPLSEGGTNDIKNLRPLQIQNKINQNIYFHYYKKGYYVDGENLSFYENQDNYEANETPVEQGDWNYYYPEDESYFKWEQYYKDQQKRNSKFINKVKKYFDKHFK